MPDPQIDRLGEIVDIKAEHRREIALLEAEEKEIRETRRNRVTPIYRYELVPTTKTPFGSPILDDTIVVYTLDGICTNREESEAAGHSPKDGGMDYYYNTGTGKFIISTGGGTYYVSGVDFWQNRDDVYVFHTWERLGKFVQQNPNGGDITDIVNFHRALVEKVRQNQKGK